VSEPGEFADAAKQPRRRRGPAAATAVVAALVVAGVTVGAVAIARGGGDDQHRAPVTALTPRADATTDPVALTADVPCPNRPEARVDPPTPEELAAFKAVTAVVCGYGYIRNATEGEWDTRVRRVATSSVADLQAAYELPDESLTNGACTDDLRIPPAIILVDADGHWVFPVAPSDQCRKPRPELEAALKALVWQDVWEHKIDQLSTPEAVAANCSMRWKNENWMYADLGASHPGPGGPVKYFDPATAHVCLYKSSADDFEVGDFQRGVKLDQRQAQKLVDALTGAGPTGDCPNVAEFAVVQSDIGDSLNVELGGCWRVNREGGTGTADASVVRNILGLD
jgi:hypothetical protein